VEVVVVVCVVLAVRFCYGFVVVLHRSASFFIVRRSFDVLRRSLFFVVVLRRPLFFVLRRPSSSFVAVRHHLSSFVVLRRHLSSFVVLRRPSSWPSTNSDAERRCDVT